MALIAMCSFTTLACGPQATQATTPTTAPTAGPPTATVVAFSRATPEATATNTIAPATSSPVPPPVPSPTPSRTASPVPSPTVSATAAPDPTTGDANVPIGFPLPPNVAPWRVLEGPQGGEVVPPALGGPTILEVARDKQTRVENDMEANRYGWNCRLHATYEGAPAVDWYLPEGTPLYATMDGQAELAVITTVNSFAYYGVDPGLYVGLPSPGLPRYLFPGPSGGMGVFVSVLNGNLRADYGHVNLEQTLDIIPDNAFLPPYSRKFGYDSRFSRPLNAGEETVVARWPARKSQKIAVVGNNGYSDVPHLHYQVVTKDRKTKYCPTDENFPSAGWLFRVPAGFR